VTPLASETTAMVDQTSDDTGRRQMRLRCAIYTRKSNEEGLEQDFNSLDAHGHGENERRQGREN
jgi:hypothetical protein